MGVSYIQSATVPIRYLSQSLYHLEKKTLSTDKTIPLERKDLASLSLRWRILYPDSPAPGHPIMHVLNVRSDFSVTFSTEHITLPTYVLEHMYACIHIQKYTYTHMHKHKHTHTISILVSRKVHVFQESGGDMRVISLLGPLY